MTLKLAQRVEALVRWTTYEELVDRQLTRLRRVRWLRPSVAKLEELSSWAIASAMHIDTSMVCARFVPVIPLHGVLNADVAKYLGLIPVLKQQIEVTENLPHFLAARNQPREPYYLLAASLNGRSLAAHCPDEQFVMEQRHRYLSGAEIIALGIHYAPTPLSNFGFWAGASAFPAVDVNDDDIGMAYSFVQLHEGQERVLSCGNAVPERGDDLVWPTCAIRNVEEPGIVIGGPQP